jgi:hypothetical protein
MKITWRLSGLLILAVDASLPSVGAAQKLDLGFQKGDSVTLGIPFHFMTERRGGLLGTNIKYDIDVRSGPSDVEVREPGKKGEWRTDWRAAGFPSGRLYQVGKIKVTDRDSIKGKWIEVTLTVRPTVDYRVYAPEKDPQALRGAIAPEGKTDSAYAASYAALGDRMFTGPLASFSADERRLLLAFAHTTALSTQIASEDYKDNLYLVLSLPEDGSIWNDLKVNRAQRLGRLIGDRLSLLKAFAKVAVPHDSIGGLKLEQGSRHGTAPDYRDAKADQVEAYFPLSLLVKFADADITSQALVNGSIILLNSDRIDVDLSTQ